jgi:non-heme Fe2+,alpha-ketoglutarate-dependent halogenase
VFGPLSLLDQAEVARLLELCVAAHSVPSPIYGQPTLRDRHLQWPEVLSACSRPRLLDLVAACLGQDLILWRSKFMVKPPGGAEIVWHRDGRFPGGENRPALERPLAVSAWIALTPTALVDGGLEFVSGSHLYPADARPWGEAEPLPPHAPRRSYTLSAGDAVVFTALVLHRSAPNFADHVRVGLSARFTIPSNRVNAALADGIDGQGHSIRDHVSVLVRGEAAGSPNRVVDPPQLFH